MKYVAIYESGDNVRELAPVHFPAHRARWQKYREDGSLLLIGAFTDFSGSMGVFSTRESAEDFVKGDPFVLHGVAKSWRIVEWNEVLSPGSTA